MNINDLRQIAESDSIKVINPDTVEITKRRQFSKDELLAAADMLQKDAATTGGLLASISQLLAELDKE